jgi:hypothetical protein
MYDILFAITFLLTYFIILISPFIDSLRRIVIEWDDYNAVGDGPLNSYYYIQFLKDGKGMRRSHLIEDMTDGGFIGWYILIHIVLGCLLSIMIGLAWPILVIAVTLTFIIKRVLKSIKNKNKTK